MNTPQSIAFVCAAMSTPGFAYVTVQVPEAIAPRPVVTDTSDTNRRRFSYVAAANGHVIIPPCAAGFGMGSGGGGGIGLGYGLVSGGGGGFGLGAATARAGVWQACARRRRRWWRRWRAWGVPLMMAYPRIRRAAPGCGAAAAAGFGWAAVAAGLSWVRRWCRPGYGDCAGRLRVGRGGGVGLGNARNW